MAASPRPRWAALGDLAAALVLLLPVFVILERSWDYGPWCAAIGGVLDVRFVTYVLEHGYRYLTSPGSFPDGLWSPPFFYPVENALAYSESLLAAQPFYAPLRRAGLSPASAVFVYHLSQRALTPLVAYACLRWSRFGRWPSFVAAALFSWGWIRFIHYGHIQFAAGYTIPLFFTALYALIFRRRAWGLAVMALTFLATWYGSLYTAVFLVLGSLAVVLVALALPGGWRRARGTLRWAWRFARRHPRQAVAILLICLTSAALAVPSALVYLQVFEQYGPATRREVGFYFGDVYTWVRPPTSHPWLAGLRDLFPATQGHERTKFLGFLGVACVLAPLLGWAAGWLTGWVGSWRPRGEGTPGRRGAPFRAWSSAWSRGWSRARSCSWPRPVVIAAGAALGLMLVFSAYPFAPGLERPFWFLHSHFPGLGGLRAPSRIAFVISWFAAVCAASVLQRLGRGARGGFRAGAQPGRLWPRGAATAVALSALAGGALLAEGIGVAPFIANRCVEEGVWNRTAEHLCAQVPGAQTSGVQTSVAQSPVAQTPGGQVAADPPGTDPVGTVLFLPIDIHSIRDIRQNGLAMGISQQCDLRVVNGYSGKRPHLLAPLLASPARELPCDDLRHLLDEVHARSGEGVLVHLDEGGPQGPPGYPVGAVRRCLRPCTLAERPEWAVPMPSRPARLFVTDPARACAPPPPGPGRATAGSGPPGGSPAAPG